MWNFSVFDMYDVVLKICVGGIFVVMLIDYFECGAPRTMHPFMLEHHDIFSNDAEYDISLLSCGICPSHYKSCCPYRFIDNKSMTFCTATTILHVTEHNMTRSCVSAFTSDNLVLWSILVFILMVTLKNVCCNGEDNSDVEDDRYFDKGDADESKSPSSIHAFFGA